jgi:hypothetical protein
MAMIYIFSLSILRGPNIIITEDAKENPNRDLRGAFGDPGVNFVL